MPIGRTGLKLLPTALTVVNSCAQREVQRVIRILYCPSRTILIIASRTSLSTYLTRTDW